MTTDERLDRLTERHEALTQSVEMLNLRTADLLKTAGDLLKATEIDGENIRALARIAEMHERRLTDLEGHDA